MLLVIALGGNALLRRQDEPTMAVQFLNAQRALRSLMPLFKKHHVVLTHGNGPQVGNIVLRSEAALGTAYSVPLSVAVAQSEGEIGYVLEQSLLNELRRARIKKSVASLLTQVVVESKDPAFKKPTKPIGRFYTKAEAAILAKKGKTVQDVGNGYRVVVPSPRPKKIIESTTITTLVKSGVVAIVSGGGGIPVVEKKESFHGVDAVIDKDLASSLLARHIHADVLLILTDVPCVYIGYKKKKKKMSHMTVTEAKHYLALGEFPSGSMGPKVLAAIEFVSACGKAAIITSPDFTLAALKKHAGTWITK